MPNYVYNCSHCEYQFERFFSISQYQKEVTCPNCGQPAQLTISGGMGLIFKGSGFYITDYKGKSNGTSSQNGKKSESNASKEASSSTGGEK